MKKSKIQHQTNTEQTQDQASIDPQEQQNNDKTQEESQDKDVAGGSENVLDLHDFVIERAQS